MGVASFLRRKASGLKHKVVGLFKTLCRGPGAAAAQGVGEGAVCARDLAGLWELASSLSSWVDMVELSDDVGWW